ncbi:hypothetical protein DM860_016451 [Cuscuta australis]|uniref:Leucine-rich repeat-containing N-terminal plant-type domain-containing protein n=1 Tax=Cuscuta australis TaxID=267555 RepID=A0A328DEH6_9ASTE|nr:hypothetical protein DM860_016451 [Cuscuta australis]
MPATMVSYCPYDSNHFSPESLTTTSLSWIGKLTKLTHLNLARLDLTGDIPSWLMNLTQITEIDMSHNQLTIDWVELNIFSHLTKLTTIILSYNHFSLSIKSTSTKNVISFPSLKFLGLASCNLSEFPTILHNGKNTLEYLDLSDNNLKGQIPPWIFDLGQNSEEGLSLNLSNNLLTGFEQDDPVFHPRDKIRTLDLRHNMLQGSLPIPPPFPSFSSYLISNNSFSGEVSHLICNLTSLEHLDLSFNRLSGKLPQCLSNFSDSLSLLALGGNKFDGSIPSAWNSKCKLRMISMRDNQLQGQLPRSLANCSSLEFIDFGNNKLTDVFPFWLETVTQLSSLILQSNGLHGVINNDFEFSNLRVINLSNNSFSGKMPSKFIETSHPMRALNASRVMSYMEQGLVPNSSWYGEDFGEFDYSMTINNKGLERSYMKIPDIFCEIDFSSNTFEGQVPDAFGDLAGLQVLNLSRNRLSGHISSSFSNMKNLETLDLSQNQLTGSIPVELTKLTSLSAFDVSYNNLSGPIPQGNQFCTFELKSFEGNVGLFFEPWNKLCGNARSLPQLQQPPSPTEEECDGSESDLKIEWMIIWIGFVSGLVVGVILGNELIARKPYWFVKTLARIGI